MHTKYSILKLVSTHNDPLHVSATHLAIFKEVKYKGWNYYKCRMELQNYQNQSTDTK
jgi:hypothetical protein